MNREPDVSLRGERTLTIKSVNTWRKKEQRGGESEQYVSITLYSRHRVREETSRER